MDNKGGIFTISLDFELHWGVSPRMRIEDYRKNLDGTRESIMRTLELFKKYNIHATWATVGLLFMSDKNEMISNLPKILPSYKNNLYSNYRLLDEIGHNEIQDPYHYAISIIQKLNEVAHQEIATHTFSHFFGLEEGADILSFEADIIKAKEIATNNGIEILSIVFPRNQFSNEMLEVCKRNNIKTYRGNIDNYIYKPRKRDEETLLLRFLRIADSILPVTQSEHTLKRNHTILNIPASRFLRPYNSKLPFINKLQIRRILIEMENAAKNNLLYHLWWHPHNFGINIEKNLENLELILKHYTFLERKYNFKSLNMKDIYLLNE